MLAFVAAVVLLTATPGPGVLSVAGVGAAFGRRAGLRFVWGVFLGTNAVAVLAASGLAASVLALPGLRAGLLAGSLAYLCWLAWRIARQGGQAGLSRPARAPGAAEGVVLQLTNPKAYAVNLSLFSGFPMAGGLVAELVLKFAVINAVWVVVHFAWLAAGAAVAEARLGPLAWTWINRGMAASLVAVALLSAAVGLRAG